MFVNLYPVVLALYSLGAITQARASLAHNKPLKLLSPSLGLFAIALHGYLLYQWIDVTGGQNLADFNLLSLAIWLTAIFILSVLIFRPVAYLNIIIYPIAALSVFLAVQFPAIHVIQTATDLKQCFHILLSIVTFSVLFLAGIQAITLAVQEKFLKQKSLGVSLALPAIESMEKTLFETIAVGAFLLSLVLVTSVLFFHAVVFSTFLQKTILTMIAWFIFSALLVGRYYFGWRGKKAIYCTLGGVAILSLIYFSSIIIMEFLP